MYNKNMQKKLYIKTEIWSIINKIKVEGRLKVKCAVQLPSVVS